MLALSDVSARLQAGSSAWVDVCALEDIVPGTGVAALVERQQIAIFRPSVDGPIYALSNFDPFSHAFVMARGIIGDKNGTLKVASPIYKQNFELETGQCLEDPNVRLTSYPARVVSGRVWVSADPNAVEP